MSPTSVQAAALQVDRVSYRYGDTLALDSVSLDIEAGELVTVVGPSGCGKSTLLRLVAGLLQPSEGGLSVGGKDVSGVAPEKRGVGWVPQSYGLFEHLNVAQNVAFGPRMQGVARDERDKTVGRLLELCHISDLANRPVSALSGGQRQRVAVARALAASPKLLLLDEPLAALDPQLRLELRTSLEQLLRESGVTTLFVTHDQEEALALADRVAVLSRGKLEQFATPETLWQQPASEFVAKFVGHAVVVQTRRADSGHLELLPGLCVERPGEDAPAVALRASDLALANEGAALTVSAVEYAGGGYLVTGESDTGLKLRCHSEQRPTLGEHVRVAHTGRTLTTLQ